MQISLNIQTFCYNLKIRGLGAKVCVWLFYYFYCYDVLKSKRLCFLLNKNIYFNKNKAGSKMKNHLHTYTHTHTFTEISLELQLIQKLQIKSKTVMSWSCKKKSAVFVMFVLSEEIFLKICVSSQCMVYWIHFQNIYTFTYEETLLHTLLLLVFKIVFIVSLMETDCHTVFPSIHTQY